MNRTTILVRLLQLLGVLALVAALALAFALHAARASGWALVVIALAALAVWVYVSPRFMAWRYIVPGALAAAVFIVFPMAYTLGISFTNYSGEHLLSFDRATDVLLARGDGDGRSLAFTLEPAGGKLRRLRFVADDGARFASQPFTLGETVRVPLAADPQAPGGAAAAMRELAEDVTALRRPVLAGRPPAARARFLRA